MSGRDFFVCSKASLRKFGLQTERIFLPAQVQLPFEAAYNS